MESYKMFYRNEISIYLQLCETIGQDSKDLLLETKHYGHLVMACWSTADVRYCIPSTSPRYVSR